MILLLHGGAANQELEINQLKTQKTEFSMNAVDVNQSAIDMVEQAVMGMEAEPIFNAGRGSVIQMDGRIRMDAGICTSQGQYGAVIQIENVINPIQVARQVMDKGYHSILSGDGATTFAREMDIPSLSPYTKERLLEYKDVREDVIELSYNVLANDVEATNVKKLSTVGAVAIDDNGMLAAACSTGGTKYCYPGRVGDTPIYGAGVYCSEYVAIACSGEGDKILRRLTARRVEELYLQNGKDLQKACDDAVKDLFEKEKGYGGVIAVDNKGNYAHSHNMYFMATALKITES